MKPAGNEIAAAVKEWFYQEIKTGPSIRLDLGKFFFTAATATLGGITAILSIPVNHTFGGIAIASLLLLIAAALVGILLATPSSTKIDDNLNILAEYPRLILRIKRMIRIWTVLWLSGTVCGILAVVL